MNYVGIDLGTTNSALATYDGKEVQLFKSPEQHDVTPSAIFVDRRGNRYVGSRAYNNAALDPANAAILFKRQMGTSTRFPIPNLGKELTPEECSAEILRTLFGYLPEAVRRSSDIGTVITVPAAFDQMQKDATLAASEKADIGQVALMQEPVAAVMSVMRKRRSDGIFLVYDIGGGTLDMAVAQSIAGSVNLLAHGGITMCGGRDFDRAIVDNVVQPWLRANFELADDPETTKRIQRLATWAAEKAKIELSQRDHATISLSESELNIPDAAGRDLYLDVPLDRPTLDRLIADQLESSIVAARQTLSKAGLEAADVERIVFVGGPTFYAPLRERVAFELGISGSTEVNPMTAVAEGAAVFAESIDWSTRSRGRKSSRGSLQSKDVSVTFNYAARTPGGSARIAAQLQSPAQPGTEFQVDSLDTGWTSGRLPLREGALADVPLAEAGENRFRISVYDPGGGAISLRDDIVTITRTAATIDGIPASHTIAVEVRDGVQGGAGLEYLVREGEPLPKKGVRRFKSAIELRPGASGSINFKLWEGDALEPISDNHFIGNFAISGSDLDELPIKVGAELICEYEVLDSGCIVLEVNVPSAGGAFQSGRNFYSRQAGQVDFGNAGDLLREACSQVQTRLTALEGHVPEAELENVRDQVTAAETLIERADDSERSKMASERLQQVRRLLADTRKKHLQAMREMELESSTEFFNVHLRDIAKPAEIEAFDRLARTAETLFSVPEPKFEAVLEEMKSKSFVILWRQDEFVLIRFNHLAQSSHLFVDRAQHAILVSRGEAAISSGDFRKLRGIVAELDDCRIGSTDDHDLAMVANIVRTA